MLCRDKEEPFVCKYLFLPEIKIVSVFSRWFVYCTSKVNGTRVCLFIYVVVHINDRKI